jgi:lipopolysaccharide/colanic/teichoic acid biosynthesis glycosyltransferase
MVLVLTCPLMVLVGCLIAIDSGGPILYRQVRVGLNGRPFVLLKFRSMVADAEAGTGPRWAQRQDPRITRIGRFRRMKLSYDLHYIKNRSLFLDIRILLATVPVILLGRGAR